MMKAILFALFVGLLMVGCGGDIESKIQEAKESNATKLDLSDKGISDVSPLTGLTNLEELYLEANQITDLTPLAGLTKLKILNLYGNPIPDDQIEMLRKALPDCDICFD